MNWNALRRKQIFRSEDWDLVHRTLSINRSGTMLKGFKVCERPLPVLCCCCSFFSREFPCWHNLEAILYTSTSKTNVKKMQLVVNLIPGLRRYDHISEGLKSLKWLSIAVKLLLNDSFVVHKCLNGQAPDYLSQ